MEAPRAYPLLLSQSWLKMANIKQNWNRNVLTFRKGKTWIRISTQEKINTTHKCLPIHPESVNMMEGLDEVEEDQYFTKNPKIIPLFEVDILQTLTTYREDKESEIPVDEQTLKELRLQQKAIEKEMKVSQIVQASRLEELNLADTEVVPRTILIAKEVRTVEKEELKKLL